MEFWAWIVLGVMVVIIIGLLIKIHLMQKAAGEIEEAFLGVLREQSNTLIGISSGDPHMRALTNSLNHELRSLRAERHRFQQGNREIQNAVTNISHDLRTPLTAINGYLDLLEAEDQSDDARRYVAVIRNRAELMMELTEELFRYSIILTSYHDVKKEPVVLNAALEESIAAFYTSFMERGIQPDIRIPETKITRSLDRENLSRIFSNLLNNAIKYSDGDLSVVLHEDGRMEFSNTAEALSEVEVGKLFDRFYTVEAARNSTGLGLAIAKTLVEQMGGRISACYEKPKLSICLEFDQP